MISRRQLARWCALAAAGLLLACGRGDLPAASAKPGASTASAPSTLGRQRQEEQPEANASDGAFGAGIVEARSALQGTAVLTDVRSARHAGFDRIVFEFASGARPGYHVEYIDRPVRKCGSGDPTPIAGDSWLEVRFEPADAHTPSGWATIAQRERQVALGVVRELEQTCDFEAQVIWVLGVARPNKYRVLTLQQPARVVIDVAH